MLEKKIWKDLLNNLSETTDQKNFNTWINPLELTVPEKDLDVGEAESQVNLFVLSPNKFIKEHFIKNYLNEVTNYLNKKYGFEFNIEVTVGMVAQKEPEIPNKNGELVVKTEKNQDSELISSFKVLNVHSSKTFESFVKGLGNKVALSAAKKYTDNQLNSNGLLMFYGSSGVGKSHLMHAISNYVKANNKDKSIGFANADIFMRNMVSSIQMKKTSVFKKFYNDFDILLMDDLHFLAGKGKTQEEFLHIMNSFINQGKQVILSCDRHPKELEELDQKIVGLISAGLPIKIDKPDLETRYFIIKQKAFEMGLKIDHDSISTIAEKVFSNVREIEGALNLIMLNAEVRNENVNVDLINESLHDLFIQQSTRISIEQIIKEVCDYYKIKHMDIVSTRRHKFIMVPRQMAMSIAKEVTELSLNDIGKSFNKRDHSTILHACQKIAYLRSKNKQIEADYHKLIKIIKNN